MSQWKDLIQRLAEVIYQRHPTDFAEKMYRWKGYTRVYFSSRLEEIDEPRPVADSGYFIETKWGWKATTDQCRKLVQLFGYKDEDLDIYHT